jgi:hypothetical protein
MKKFIWKMDEKVQVLIESINTSTSPFYLDLSETRMNRTEWMATMKALKTNTSTKALKLFGNTRKLASIGRVLRKNDTIRSLLIDCRGANENDMLRLKRGVFENTHLIYIGFLYGDHLEMYLTDISSLTWPLPIGLVSPRYDKDENHAIHRDEMFNYMKRNRDIERKRRICSLNRMHHIPEELQRLVMEYVDIKSYPLC